MGSKRPEHPSHRYEQAAPHNDLEKAIIELHAAKSQIDIETYADRDDRIRFGHWSPGTIFRARIRDRARQGIGYQWFVMGKRRQVHQIVPCLNSATFQLTSDWLSRRRTTVVGQADRVMDLPTFGQLVLQLPTGSYIEQVTRVLPGGEPKTLGHFWSTLMGLLRDEASLPDLLPT